MARSNFNVYLGENALTYLKDPCGPEDTEAYFFLHLTPGNPDDLPTLRRQHGFDNLAFPFYRHGVIFDGKCWVTAKLPEYDITNIRTGQYVPGGDQVWKEEFPLRE